jgi:hypothetical protein
MIINWNSYLKEIISDFKDNPLLACFHQKYKWKDNLKCLGPPSDIKIVDIYLLNQDQIKTNLSLFSRKNDFFEISLNIHTNWV